MSSRAPVRCVTRQDRGRRGPLLFIRRSSTLAAKTAVVKSLRQRGRVSSAARGSARGLSEPAPSRTSNAGCSTREEGARGREPQVSSSLYNAWLRQPQQSSCSGHAALRQPNNRSYLISLFL